MPFPSIVMGLLLLAAADADDREALRAAVAEFQMGMSTSRALAARGRFRRAADLFADLRRRGYENADLCRNEGNAALLAGDVPRAILAYRRGLRFSAGDRELRENLAYARSRVATSTADGPTDLPGERWPSWLPRPSLQMCLALATTAYAALCCCWTRWRMNRHPRLLQATVACYVTAAILGVAAAAHWWHLADESARPLVVVAKEDVVLRKGNGVSYPPRRDQPLARGAEARLLFDRGSWLQVQLPGGEVGWLPRADVLMSSE